MVGMVWLELRTASRALMRSPGFSLTAIAMLAVGFGLTLYMFGAINGFLLREVPFPEGERLMHVEYADLADRNDAIEVPTSDFLTLRREQRVFQRLEGFSQGTINLADSTARPERYNGALISAGSFDTLGVQPILGPGFRAGDDAPGAAGTVVLGYSLWQQRFGADPDIIGREVRVNGRPAQVVGVMPQGFAFPINNAVWVPLNLGTRDAPRREQISLEVFGRLVDGATLEQAAGELEALLARIEEQDTGPTLAEKVVVKPYRDEFIGEDTRQVLGTMFAAVLLVLAIACVNVSNLMIARSVQRNRETAIRAAIGASRWRLMGSNLAEVLLIACAALAIGTGLAFVGDHYTIEALRTSEDPPPYWVLQTSFFEVQDPLFAIGTVLLVVLMAGLWPAWRAASAAQAEGMREGGRVAGGRASSSLTVLEIALCMVLLVTSGLTVRSVIARDSLAQPFNGTEVLGGRVGLFDGDYPDDNAIRDFAARLLPRLLALPSVEAAGISSSLPYSFTGGDLLQTEAALQDAEGVRPYANVVSADRGYFETLEIPLLRGRGFESRDRADAPPVALVSELLARRLWPDADPVGQRLRLGAAGSEGDWIEVIGVVPHMPQSGSVDTPSLYRPFEQAPTRFFSPVLRGAVDPMSLGEPMRDAVIAVDANLPVYFLRTPEDWRRIASFDIRLMAVLFGVFGAFAVLLAAAGLYAVLAYQVGQRVREIGVRRALGADDRGILRMVARQGAWQLALGLGIGLLLALGFARLLSGVLFGVSTHDPLTFLGVAGLLCLVGVLASLLPTRRALGVEPMVALRYD
ncbi:ABC transporter permease [Pseudomarimonas salicorniae]|uniref:ABC transporter permease n=1 Tax=Pseudomarimonas salicorniae TaxID=2933270 RepID=A0ABT0GD81_9GAMM|nr:ABC transporter permease [Lysobacter sp. CAU 1642]MCK7592504.1 ABC transporter permease [Lysobacter sp. CAU 1642]